MLALAPRLPAFRPEACLFSTPCVADIFAARTAGLPRMCATSPQPEQERLTRSSLLGFSSANDDVLPQSYFERLDYQEKGVPWDLRGSPQPPVRNAAQAGAFGPAGTVILDCGCGAGDNANWLASRGYNVLGFDLSPSAVATAEERAAAEEMAAAIEVAGGAVEFVQASAMELHAAPRVQQRADQLGGFEIALDSALLHCLDDAAQRTYLSGLRKLMRPGGRAYIGCFSDANPDPWSNPRRLSEAQLRDLFSNDGWRVLELKEAWYERPRERSTSSGGAWTMAWWCTAEATDMC
ncbi:hypothetical protein AB1Y20_000945 [Prymnesium parvum]|uniref:Methyltransferase domain-containing protein n=1 Tax=Prymnesium parvum TaxID=97485 RepID=A0AB34KC47_PRYPA|mmetsp:Transcript_35782/g.89017  ORF Transcript_35782/g.89017 Transcript_35782/m.89017 type:complete len:294 (+) Transcript_35782:13-894(+)